MRQIEETRHIEKNFLVDTEEKVQNIIIGNEDYPSDKVGHVQQNMV